MFSLLMVQKYAMLSEPPKEIPFFSVCQRAPTLFYLFPLFHRPDHRHDELNLFVRQAVLRIEFFVGPRAGEVLEGDELKTIFS